MTLLTAGVHHVGLTVPDLTSALAFFVDVLGYKKVGGYDSYPSAFISDGATMITLWQADAGASPHNRRTSVGLHHLALRVAGGDSALTALAVKLQAAAGVSVEFGPEALEGLGVRHMMVQAAGVRLEFIAA